MSSAVTVVIGLLTLLLSLFPATRGLGLACAVGVVVAAAFVLLVLPAALVLFDRWIFWPKVPREGQAALADGQSWEQTVVLPALPPGTHQIDAVLYKNDDQTPYRETHVEVTGRAAEATSKPAAP
jgi:uncharacterized membrane protein YdfJ with MMPL/SSD domain